VADAREIKEVSVEPAIVSVFAVLACGEGPRLVEQAGKVHIAAQAGSGAAWRMLGEIGRGDFGHGKRAGLRPQHASCRAIDNLWIAKTSSRIEVVDYSVSLSHGLLVGMPHMGPSQSQ
jgi:hypothetical protein